MADVATLESVAAVANSTPASPAFFVALIFYGISSLVFVSAFVDAPRWVIRLAFVLLAISFISHGVDIGFRGVAKVHPGTNVREALGFLSWLLVGGYLYWGLRYRLAVIGAFVAPAALVLLAIARLSPTGEALPGLSLLGRVHISLATVGVAIYMLATLVAIVYLLQERALKKKQFDGLLYKNHTALATLDRLSHRLVLLGFPIFTAAIMLGVIWVAERGFDVSRIEYPLALVVWAVFAVLVVARSVRGWRGRRAAVWTILGFVGAVLVLLIYLLRRAL